MAVPLNRVKQIEFAGKKIDKAEHEPGNIRATFGRGGAVTFQLEKWEGGKVLGNSPNFGKLAFDATAFSRVELRLKPASP